MKLQTTVDPNTGAKVTYVLDHYIYSINAASIAAGASQSFPLSIEADSNFTWEKTSVFASLAGATQTQSSQVLPQVTVQIQDSGSGRLLQNIPVQITSMAGNGQLPFVLPVPRVFKARSTVIFTLVNTSAAETYTNLQLSLIGYKSFFLS